MWLTRAAPGGGPALAHHTFVRRMDALPGSHTRISVFPCRYASGRMPFRHAELTGCTSRRHGRLCASRIYDRKQQDMKGPLRPHRRPPPLLDIPRPAQAVRDGKKLDTISGKLASASPEKRRIGECLSRTTNFWTSHIVFCCAAALP